MQQQNSTAAGQRHKSKQQHSSSLVAREAVQTFAPIQRDSDALTKTKAISKQQKIFKVLHKSQEFNNGEQRKTSPTIQFSTEDVSTSKQRKHRQEMRSRLNLRPLVENNCDSNSSVEDPISGMTVQILHQPDSYITPEKKSLLKSAHLTQVVTSGCSTGQICSDQSQQSNEDNLRDHNSKSLLSKRKVFNSQTLGRFEYFQDENQQEEDEPFVSAFNPFKYGSKKLKSSENELMNTSQQALVPEYQEEETGLTLMLNQWNLLELTPELLLKSVIRQSPEYSTPSLSFVLNPEESLSNFQSGFELCPEDYLNEDQFQLFLKEIQFPPQLPLKSERESENELMMTPLQSNSSKINADGSSISRFNFAPSKLEATQILLMRPFDISQNQMIPIFSSSQHSQVSALSSQRILSPIHFPMQLSENESCYRPSPTIAVPIKVHGGDGGQTPESESLSDVTMMQF